MYEMPEYQIVKYFINTWYINMVITYNKFVETLQYVKHTDSKYISFKNKKFVKIP